MSSGAYVLITAVRDEGATIGITIDSVRTQTRLPAEWVIVDDGSTDKTTAIVATAAAQCGWLRHLQLPHRPERSFSAMVSAIKAGKERLSCVDYEYIGLLDGDLRLERDYFAAVLQHFQEHPRLGLAGGRVVDPDEDAGQLPHNRADVPGAVQLFRRRCYEQVRGYLPIPEGGFDAIACAHARMCGFETQLLPDLVVAHLKPRNASAGGRLRRKWQLGVRDYALGYHPLFELAKCLGRLREPPVVLGAIAWWTGYAGRALARRPRVVPAELVAYLRREQMDRLRAQLRL